MSTENNSAIKKMNASIDERLTRLVEKELGDLVENKLVAIVQGQLENTIGIFGRSQKATIYVAQGKPDPTLYNTALSQIESNLDRIVSDKIEHVLAEKSTCLVAALNKLLDDLVDQTVHKRLRGFVEKSLEDHFDERQEQMSAELRKIIELL